MRILLVDDTMTARIFAKKCLKGIGFHDAEFIQAKNGMDALEKLAQGPAVDLILTDLMMPEMDGEELLKELKGNPAWQEIPVIVVSSAGNMARKESLLALGAKNVLGKPFSTTEMYEIVKDFLDEEDEDEW